MSNLLSFQDYIDPMITLIRPFCTNVVGIQKDPFFFDTYHSEAKKTALRQTYGKANPSWENKRLEVLPVEHALFIAQFKLFTDG